MDHQSIADDAEDLRRYRAGEAPLQRAEITLGPESIMSQDELGKVALDILKSILEKQK